VKPLPLSHSTLDKFKNCPRQYHALKVIHSVADPKGEAALWGDYVHQHFEKYLLAKGAYKLPDNLEKYTRYLDDLLRMPGEQHVERPLAVSTKLRVCAFDAPDVFLRGYADFMTIKDTRASIIDHKTGKRKPDSKQMKMMALLTFLIDTQVERIRVAFAWLKTNEYDSDEFTRSDVPSIWAEFTPDMKQYADAFKNDIWQPRQSGLCHGWCPVHECEFWKPKRLDKR
jgi:hypothetical protein